MGGQIGLTLTRPRIALGRRITRMRVVCWNPAGPLSKVRNSAEKKPTKLGTFNPVKAFELLAILNEADEKSPLLNPALHYHKFQGASKYSIDADSRKSPWRITFQWENLEMKNVSSRSDSFHLYLCPSCSSAVEFRAPPGGPSVRVNIRFSNRG